ncbi:MAG: NADH-quinone oxidoreductase subunit NuoK [Candidatus Cloacimonadota bacterium]|nr:MAG: NADH-quinone oxidoreductase subunit NuoK [Candidatus Cloacimonadota bacterium]
MTLTHYLVLATILICIGYLGMIVRKSAIGMLISLEIIFNGINLTAVAFNRFLYPDGVIGQIMVIFIITIAAAETAIALAIMLNLFKQFKTIDVDEINLMKW